MSLPAAFAGTLKIAPVGTDLCDTDSWVDLTSSIESVTFKGEAPSPDADDRRLLDILNESIATAVLPPPASASDIRQNVLDAMQAIRDAPYRPAWGGGAELVTSEWVPRGQVWIMSGGAQVVIPEAEYREYTEAEYAGIIGRRIVRHGMADVLEWLGEEVGPAPEDPLPRAFKFLARTMVQDRHAAPWFTHTTQRMVEPGEPI